MQAFFLFGGNRNPAVHTPFVMISPKIWNSEILKTCNEWFAPKKKLPALSFRSVPLFHTQQQTITPCRHLQDIDWLLSFSIFDCFQSRSYMNNRHQLLLSWALSSSDNGSSNRRTTIQTTDTRNNHQSCEGAPWVWRIANIDVCWRECSAAQQIEQFD